MATIDVINLQNENKKLLDLISNLEKNQIKKCLICKEHNVEYMWSTCSLFSTSRIGHLTVCFECVQFIQKSITQNRCPICRADDGCWVQVDARA